MSELRQCRRCGGCCGGGYTDKGGRYHYCKAGNCPAPPAPMSDRERELVDAAKWALVYYRDYQRFDQVIVWNELKKAIAKYD